MNNNFTSQRLTIFNDILLTTLGNDSTTQRQRLLRAFERLVSFTHWEAQRFLGIASPAKRISELAEKYGLQVHREWEVITDESLKPRKTKKYTSLGFKPIGDKK